MEAEPKQYYYLNTLGIAYYRAGHYQEAVDTLRQGMKLDPAGGAAWDFFFMAMAHQQLDEKANARESYERAIDWIEQNKPEGNVRKQLDQFRTEAEMLMGIDGSGDTDGDDESSELTTKTDSSSEKEAAATP